MTFSIHAVAQRARRARGLSMLVVLILIVVLTLMAFAVITMASREVDAVSAKRRFDKGVSCAESARNLLLSQFQLYGQAPTSLVLNTVLDDRLLATGHFDNVSVTGVTSVSSSSATTPIGATDMSNRITRRGLGGQLFRINVVCSKADGSGAPIGEQNEVEYLVRFGL